MKWQKIELNINSGIDTHTHTEKQRPETGATSPHNAQICAHRQEKKVCSLVTGRSLIIAAGSRRGKARRVATRWFGIHSHSDWANNARLISAAANSLLHCLFCVVVLA